MMERLIPQKQIWKMILILIVTMMLTLMLFLTEFSARLSPALLSQNNQPTQQVDASPTPAYNPKINFHWPSRTISYHITYNTPAHFRRAWQRAVKAWNAVNVVDLISTNHYQKADIILGVKNSYHSAGGTVENISGGVVGYTSEEFGHVNGVPLFVHQNKSYLVISSMKQAHYDAVNEQASVAMHELGHDLGLEHSDSPHSIMQQAAPTYLYSIPEVDAKHLQQLYKGIS